MTYEEILPRLHFDAQGLIPAIVQDYATQQVLTLAYMNAESLRISLAEGNTCFYSRSRRCLWRKGETSGNTQRIVALRADCDGDALVVEVRKAGPACHTGAESCFFNELYTDEERKPFSLAQLKALLHDRRINPAEGSYTTYLFAKGRDKILKKVGEECTEVIVAGAKNDRDETIYELADLAYHALVLMEEMDIPLDAVVDELARRHVVDHKVKQERMK